MSEIDDTAAGKLASNIAKECRLVDIVEESVGTFYLGQSILGAMARACLLVIALTFLLTLRNHLEFALLIVAAFLGVIEFNRINRKMEALTRLLRIEMRKNPLTLMKHAEVATDPQPSP